MALCHKVREVHGLCPLASVHGCQCCPESCKRQGFGGKRDESGRAVPDFPLNEQAFPCCVQSLQYPYKYRQGKSRPGYRKRAGQDMASFRTRRPGQKLRALSRSCCIPVTIFCQSLPSIAFLAKFPHFRRAAARNCLESASQLPWNCLSAVQDLLLKDS